MKQFKKLLLLCTIMPLWSILLFAQGPDTLWTKTYGGSNDDWGYSMQQTTDGGYIIAGACDSFDLDGDSSDVYIVKTDTNGNEIWSKTYGGQGIDKGYSVQQTADGGYIIAGMQSGDVYAVKTYANGERQWASTYGWDGIGKGYSVEQTTDGGYIIAGSHVSNDTGSTVLIKIDSVGDTIWKRKYGGTAWEEGRSVRQTSEGGYVVAGTKNNKMFLMRTDTLGNQVWKKIYGAQGVSGGHSVEQTTDGGYIIAGYTDLSGSGFLNDVYLVKTDSSGETLWTQAHGGQSDDIGYAVEQTTDGGYIICGYTASFGTGVRDVYLVKTDVSGDSLWTGTYGGINKDIGYAVEQTTEGGYIIAGYTASFGAGAGDLYLIRTKSMLGITENNVPSKLFSFGLNSNPVKGQAIFKLQLSEDAMIHLRIYDATGRLVDTPISSRKSADSYEIPWISATSCGVYFYTFNTLDQHQIGKFVFIR